MRPTTLTLLAILATGCASRGPTPTPVAPAAPAAHPASHDQADVMPAVTPEPPEATTPASPPQPVTAPPPAPPATPPTPPPTPPTPAVTERPTPPPAAPVASPPPPPDPAEDPLARASIMLINDSGERIDYAVKCSASTQRSSLEKSSRTDLTRENRCELTVGSQTVHFKDHRGQRCTVKGGSMRCQ
jgi:hypothetical protein